MNVLHVTASLKGGAGIAAMRSVEALRAAGVDVSWLTGEEVGTTGKWRARWDYLPLRLYRRKSLFTAWSNGWLANGVAKAINRANPDLVHLHWMGHGFMSVDEVALIQAPIVWTLHDAWTFTGGCHYPDTCAMFLDGCGRCPQLGSNVKYDLSHWNRAVKRSLMELSVSWVCPSEWLRQMAICGGPVAPAQIRTIPNALNLEIFSCERRTEARKKRRLSEGQLVFAVGSMELDERRKGNQLLGEVLANWRKFDADSACTLLVFGANETTGIKVAGITVVPTGFLQTPEEVAGVLSAADAFILPSLQDNLPNVAIEAQACGCPTIGFDSGGLGEIVENGITGWLAPNRDTAELGRLLAVYTLGSFRERTKIADACRARALRLFDPKKHAAELIKCYQELLL